MEKKVIHIVDDEIDILESMKEQLEILSDCQIHVYASVAQAQEGLLKDPYGVLITDIRMPEQDGFSLLQWLPSENIHLNAIICMSGYSDYSLDQFRQYGVTHFFKKALCFESLIDSLEEILQEIENPTKLAD